MFKRKRFLNKPKNALTKAVVVFVLLMFVVYAFGLWLNIRTQNFVRRQIVDNVHLQLMYLAESLDRDIEHVFRQQVTLSNDPNLRRLALYNNLSDMGSIFVNLRRIGNNFAAIHNSSSHVSDIGVYLPNLNRISRWGLLFSQPSEDDRVLINSIQNNDRHVFTIGEDLIIGMTLHDRLLLTPAPGSAVSFVRFSGFSIGETLNQMANAYGLTIALFYDEELVITAGNNIDDKRLLGGNLGISTAEPYFLRNAQESVWMLNAPFSRFNFNLVAVLPNTQADITVIPTMIATVVLFAASMIIGAAIFTMYISRLIKQIYQQKQASEKARLGQLHLQITPHFLYNSFYQIYRLGKMGDVETVSEMSLKLSQYYQYITRSKDDDITLQLEVRHAEDYAAIQSIRSGGRVECIFEPIPKQCIEMKMPKLFLQPLVENAYIHGTNNTKGLSKIHVGFVHEDKSLLIYVEDDGNCPDDEFMADLRKRLSSSAKTKETSSLFNILQRLEFMYEGKVYVDVLQGKAGGFRIEIIIKGVS